MAFKEIQAWADILNESEKERREYVTACERKQRISGLMSESRLNEENVDVIDPVQMGFPKQGEASQFRKGDLMQFVADDFPAEAEATADDLSIRHFDKDGSEVLQGTFDQLSRWYASVYGDGREFRQMPYRAKKDFLAGLTDPTEPDSSFPDEITDLDSAENLDEVLTSGDMGMDECGGDEIDVRHRKLNQDSEIDFDSVDEADYREKMAHCFDYLGLNTSTANLAAHDTAAYLLNENDKEILKNSIRNARKIADGMKTPDDVKKWIKRSSKKINQTLSEMEDKTVVQDTKKVMGSVDTVCDRVDLSEGEADQNPMWNFCKAAVRLLSIIMDNVELGSNVIGKSARNLGNWADKNLKDLQEKDLDNDVNAITGGLSEEGDGDFQTEGEVDQEQTVDAAGEPVSDDDTDDDTDDDPDDDPDGPGGGKPDDSGDEDSELGESEVFRCMMEEALGSRKYALNNAYFGSNGETIGESLRNTKGGIAVKTSDGKVGVLIGAGNKEVNRWLKENGKRIVALKTPKSFGLKLADAKDLEKTDDDQGVAEALHDWVSKGSKMTKLQNAVVRLLKKQTVSENDENFEDDPSDGPADRGSKGPSKTEKVSRNAGSNTFKTSGPDELMSADEFLKPLNEREDDEDDEDGYSDDGDDGDYSVEIDGVKDEFADPEQAKEFARRLRRIYGQEDDVGAPSVEVDEPGNFEANSARDAEELKDTIYTSTIPELVAKLREVEANGGFKDVPDRFWKDVEQTMRYMRDQLLRIDSDTGSDMTNYIWKRVHQAPYNLSRKYRGEEYVNADGDDLTQIVVNAVDEMFLPNYKVGRKSMSDEMSSVENPFRTKENSSFEPKTITKLELANRYKRQAEAARERDALIDQTLQFLDSQDRLLDGKFADVSFVGNLIRRGNLLSKEEIAEFYSEMKKDALERYGGDERNPGYNLEMMTIERNLLGLRRGRGAKLPDGSVGNPKEQLGYILAGMSGKVAKNSEVAASIYSHSSKNLYDRIIKAAEYATRGMLDGAEFGMKAQVEDKALEYLSDPDTWDKFQKTVLQRAGQDAEDMVKAGVEFSLEGEVEDDRFFDESGRITPEAAAKITKRGAWNDFIEYLEQVDDSGTLVQKLYGAVTTALQGKMVNAVQKDSISSTAIETMKEADPETPHGAALVQRWVKAMAQSADSSLISKEDSKDLWKYMQGDFAGPANIGQRPELWKFMPLNWKGPAATAVPKSEWVVYMPKGWSFQRAGVDPDAEVPTEPKKKRQSGRHKPKGQKPVQAPAPDRGGFSANPFASL